MKSNINEFLPNTNFECDLDELFIGVCLREVLKSAEYETDSALTIVHFTDVWSYISDALEHRADNLISDAIVHEFYTKFVDGLFNRIVSHPIFDNLRQWYSQYLSDEDYTALDPRKKYVQDLFTNIGTLQLSLMDFLTRLPDYESTAARVMEFVGVVDVYEDYDEEILATLFKDVELALMAGDVEGALELVSMEMFGVTEF